jgi:peptidoglycan/xylan/chitin deacetylase (PgdA/CDA1 family)
LTVIVTTSWDDGHALDMRLADLLDHYGLSATFYIAPLASELEPQSRLAASQIREIGTRFEIGGHTLTHRRLPSLTPDHAESEIVQGKKHLEDIVQSPLESFCYPSGAYTFQHVEMVRQAGFRYARTVQRYVTHASRDLLQSGTTVQAYRHILDWRGLGRRVLTTRRVVDASFCHLRWDGLAVRIFDELLDADSPSTLSIFHLWGHSWEIANNDDWRRVRRVFEYIGRHGVQHRPNSRCEQPSAP